MSRSIVELKDKHLGEDIWVILAGPTMDFIHPSFFEGKVVIGQNQVYKHFPTTYVCMKDCNESPRFTRSLEECEQLDIPVIYSRYYRGYTNKGENRVTNEDSYVYEHNPRTGDFIEELQSLGDDEIIVSKSTMTSLVHIAAYMGAKNIILCGHDCGTINGKLYYDDYVETDWTSASNWGGIKSWMSKIENQTIITRKFLQEKYGVNIYSINPFLNFGLEGNEYSKL